MYNYILYTKARYLESKSILGMKIPMPSLARNGTTNWPTKCVNMKAKTMEIASIKPIIITQARL